MAPPRYRDTKTPEEARFYGSKEWKAARKRHRDAHPLCEDCRRMGRTELGDVVDHIIPRRERPDLELDPSNLQTLCDPHHNAKRRRERNGKADEIERGCDVDGLPLDPRHQWNQRHSGRGKV